MEKIKDFHELQEKLATFFSEKHLIIIQREDIFNALALLLSDKENLEWIGWLNDIDISYEQAKELLLNFNFETLNQRVITTEEIIPIEFLFQFKARFKVDNLIWIIHRYDADPFPSNPHAHELTQNIKLDLSNGKCYRVRKFLYTITKKELIIIRNAAMKVYKDELPDLAI